jgi:hypothetical protein
LLLFDVVSVIVVIGVAVDVRCLAALICLFQFVFGLFILICGCWLFVCWLLFVGCCTVVLLLRMLAVWRC